MWAYESVLYQIYPLGFCGAPYENKGIKTHAILKVIEKEDGTQEAVKDWICGMTDRYAIRLYDKLFVPHSWR